MRAVVGEARSYQRLEGSRGRGPLFSGERASRTPGPEPFSGINSMPAVSSAWRIDSKFAEVVEGNPSSASARLTVATPTLAALASSSALQRTNARAALIWALPCLDEVIRIYYWK